ncbi:hypothetical protein CQ13_37945 [Bradyrhizobium retamae]|uniref:Uncharacterized protein n=1 Tax=Bradyrhizobium retamae TaxID=1300035 RepID=A0A0R3NCM9_9BRAD|nr:hypothetical protein CQ13_37945 [Bradyrhizobium retamae]
MDDGAHGYQRGADCLNAVRTNDAAHDPAFEIAIVVGAHLFSIIEQVLDDTGHRAVVSGRGDNDAGCATKRLDQTSGAGAALRDAHFERRQYEIGSGEGQSVASCSTH